MKTITRDSTLIPLRLQPEVKEKMHRMARGEVLPGHRLLHAELPTLQKLRNTLAIAKIALLGR